MIDLGKLFSGCTVLVLLVTACTTDLSPRRSNGLNWTIESNSRRNEITVILKNSGERAQCVPNDAVQKFDSDAVSVRARRGARIFSESVDGYLVPQLPGFYRVEPGQSVAFRLSAERRFIDIEATDTDLLEISVGVSTWDCDELVTGRQRATWSNWFSVTSRR